MSAAKKLNVFCPSCGEPAKACQTRYGVRHDCCGLTSWDYKPLASKETLKARQMAHLAFDKIWKQRLASRSYAYQLLASEMRIHPTRCHISMMDEDTAKRVPQAAQNIISIHAYPVDTCRR